MRGFWILFMMIVFSACQQKGGDSVQILNTGIYTPISVQINGQYFSGEVFDIGEFETATEAKNLVVKITNNTMFPMTDMLLVFAASSLQTVSFLRGNDGQPSYPGAGGTCASTLLPGQSCIINLQYEATSSGTYNQVAHLDYKNLVEPDGKSLTFSFLAGTAASLVFTEDKTRYVFGEEVGPTKIPVVERAIKETYTKNLEVKNAGELSARDITLALTQSCLSSVTSQCPDGMGGVYSITHDCPTRLTSGKTCNIIVSYAPKNQDPDSGPVPPEIEDIRYESTIKAGYTNNPDNDRAVLTGYFSSVSATIEAKFDTTIDNLVFEAPLTVGNRALKQFRVNNTGYREGEFQKMILTDLTGAHIATCIKEDTTDGYLKCYNQLLTIEKTLAELPFVLKDRDNCISVNNSPDKTFTDVGKGCVFDLYFQPSISYLNPLSFDLDMYAEYDTRWKNLEVIKQRELQTLKAEAQSAARLVITSVKIASTEFVSTDDAALRVPYQSYTYDLGRQALLSSSYYKRKTFTITLKNEGQFSAKNLVFKDGRNTVIPLQSVNPVGSDLGLHSPYYFFTGTSVDDLSCTEIPPGGTCTIKSNFAPIGLNDEQKQMENMFDDLTGNQTDFVKKFITSFDDGAQYTDGNIKTAIKDIPRRSLTGNLKTTLVTKGVLSDYAGENTWNRSNLTAHNKDVKTLIFRNIGTGPISYLPSRGMVLPTAAVFMEPTTNLAAVDADFDCLEIFDFNYNPSNTIATINSRKGTWSTYPTDLSAGTGWHALPAEKACALTIRHQQQDSAKTLDVTSLSLSARGGELGRFYSHLRSGNDLWEYPLYSIADFNVRINFYDGDYTDPAIQSDPIQSQLGHLETTNSKNVPAQDFGQAKIIPSNLLPQMGAVLYRPSFTIPSLAATDGTIKAGTTIPEFWAIGPTNAIVDDPAYKPFIKGFESKNFISPSIGSLPGGYDYVIFLGTFPVGENHVSSVKLTNLGNVGTNLTNTYFETTPSPFTLASGEISGGSSLYISTPSPESAGIATTGIGNILGVRFNPTVAGRFSNILTYTYTTGEYVNLVSGAQRTQTIKILFVGDAVTTYPNITADVYDFDVLEQDGVDPIVTMQPSPSTVTPSINNNTVTPPKITLSSIKLSTPTSRDTFVKKRIVLRNTSATSKLYNLRMNLKSTVTSISSTTSIFIGSATLDQSNCAAAFANSRTGNGQASLNEAGMPGDSCYLEIKYQPKLTDLTKNTLMSFNYELKADQFIERHIAIELSPVDPATVAVTDGPTSTMSREDVYDEYGNTIPQSHPLSFGTMTMTADPQAISFNQASGTLKRLTVKNAGVTKASFLKSYHDYLDIYNPAYAGALYPSSNTVPSPSDWVVGGDGYDYTTIYLKTYSYDGSDRIRVMATRGCLFGDDENNAGIPGFQKGFNSSTTTVCRLEIYFKADINYAAKEILIKQAARMKDNYFALKYYNYNRSSVSQIPLYFHVKGLLNPPISGFSSTPIFTNVETKENGNATFTWAGMLPSAPVMGSIVGYRLYYSSTQSDITGTVFALGSTKFIDISDVNSRTRAFTSMQKGRFYYFRVVAIRQNSRYNAKYFPNLADGYFLSEVSPVTTSNYLRVAIPLTGTEYIHSLNLLVERSIYWPTPSTWSIANSKCSTRTSAVLYNGTTNVTRAYSLLTKATWDVIKFNPAYHDYGNYLQVPHWVTGGATYNIATYFGAQPGYSAAELTQSFPTPRYFYYRNSSNWNALVAMAVGGVLDTDYSDYLSLVDATAEFGVGRCIITLP